MVECLYPQPESDDGKEKRKILFGGIGLIKFLFLVLTREGMTLTMIKEYFVKNLAIISDVNVAKKENSYMFLSTSNFKIS